MAEMKRPGSGGTLHGPVFLSGLHRENTAPSLFASRAARQLAEHFALRLSIAAVIATEIGLGER